MCDAQTLIRESCIQQSSVRSERWSPEVLHGLRLHSHYSETERQPGETILRFFGQSDGRGWQVELVDWSA